MQQRSSAKQTTLQDVEKLMRPVTTQADSSLFAPAITVLSALTTTLESWIARGFLGRQQAASAANSRFSFGRGHVAQQAAQTVLRLEH